MLSLLGSLKEQACQAFDAGRFADLPQLKLRWLAALDAAEHFFRA